MDACSEQTSTRTRWGQSSGREQPKKPRKPWMCCSCTTTLCNRDKTQCGNRARQRYCCRKCLTFKWIGGSDGRWPRRRYCPHCRPFWVPVCTSQCGHLACERLASTRKEKERTELMVAVSAVWERIEQDAPPAGPGGAPCANTSEALESALEFAKLAIAFHGACSSCSCRQGAIIRGVC